MKNQMRRVFINNDMHVQTDICNTYYIYTYAYIIKIAEIFDHQRKFIDDANDVGVD